MNNQPNPKRRGCFFYGCLITGILVVLGIFVAIVCTRYVIHKVVAGYTDTAPVALPAFEATPAQIAATQQRWGDFFNDLKTDKPLPPLVLSAADLNALIAGSGTTGLKDKVRVSIEGDRLKGQVSVPLDQFKVGLLRGRYLNGSVTLKLSLRDGVLTARPEAVQTSHGPLPAAIMNKLRQQNFAEKLMDNPEALRTLEDLESIVVTNGTLVITAHKPG